MCACAEIARRFWCAGGLRVLMERAVTRMCAASKGLLYDGACGWVRLMHRENANERRCGHMRGQHPYYSLWLLHSVSSVFFTEMSAEFTAHDEGIAVPCLA